MAGDVKQVTALLQKYLSQFHLQPVMGEEEVRHWFLPQENIIDTYVVEVHVVISTLKNNQTLTRVTIILEWGPGVVWSLNQNPQLFKCLNSNCACSTATHARICPRGLSNEAQAPTVKYLGLFIF